MQALFVILAIIAGLAGLGCSIVILVEAFKDEIWKGFVCLLCGLYFLYYAFAEFDHEHKWLLILGSIGGGAVASGLLRMAGLAG